MFDALLILVAGVLLVLPGLITDVLGLLLLIPPVRRFARAQARKRFQGRFTIMHMGDPPQPGGSDDFIDVEAREVDRKPLDRDSDRS